jgi:hypothetical protein
MDWDNLLENLEARYLRGLPPGDHGLKGLEHFFLFGSGVLAWWYAEPRIIMFVWWHKPMLWLVSCILLAWSLRGLALMVAGDRWRKRLALVRRTRPWRRRSSPRVLSPLARIRAKRTATLRRE